MSGKWEFGKTDKLDQIGSAFDRTGFTVLREALDPGLVSGIARRLENELSRLRGLSGAITAEMRKSLERDEMPAHEEMARFRLEPENYLHLTSSARLSEALRRLIGEEYVWHYPSMFRKLSSANPDGRLPYHQDYSYNAHYPELFTCWVPLSDCGVDAPGLELVEKQMGERLKHSADGMWEFGVPPQELEQVLGGCREHHPEFHTGDVVLFNNLTLHRTYYTPGMTKDRLSMDARAVPVSKITKEIRKKRRFVNATKAILETLTI